MNNRHLKFNRERLLLTALVAIAFFGFLLWSIEETGSKEISLLSDFLKINSPLENKIMKITSPKINEAIKSPFIISGQALILETVLQIRIKDASGLVLAQKQIKIKESQKMSPFSSSIAYKRPTRTKGIVEIFVNSLEDGSEINKISIPVDFKD
ncbi:Gmad2 immunoglobulin-like domain-containing protein [Patescibacteria group bacterium]|nr:Gmad2 immunoglobulin-like domain-containing protein [Patescibacteria group bacterium]